jgi:transcriptional regulator with XRE-family HTH domain
MSDVVERLKEAITCLELTPNAFASKANIDSSNFGKMLEGKQKITDKTIGKLCAAHNLSVEWVKLGTGEMKATALKGNFFSPEGIYAEDSEVVIGDAVLKERIKHLQKTVIDLQGEKKAWETERKTMKKEIEELRTKNEEVSAELSKTKDRIIDMLLDRNK